jgi:plastocyanin
MRGIRLVAAVAIAVAAAVVGVRPASADDATVSITGTAVFTYSPSSRSIDVGDRVTWTNNTSATHTVTSDGAGPLDSGDISPSGTYSHTFQKAGTFAYHCQIHSNMHGTIIVSEATTTILTTTTVRPTTTTLRPTTTTARATTTTNTQTTETLALETTTSEETTTTAGQVALKTSKGGTNGAAVAILVLAIGAILGGGGYLLYRLRTGRF